MTLAEWIAASDQTGTWLAEQVGVSPMQISRISRGLQWPSGKVAERIEAVTGGEVTASDLLRTWSEHHKPDTSEVA